MDMMVKLMAEKKRLQQKLADLDSEMGSLEQRAKAFKEQRLDKVLRSLTLVKPKWSLDEYVKSCQPRLRETADAVSKFPELNFMTSEWKTVAGVDKSALGNLNALKAHVLKIENLLFKTNSELK
jgi:hypothetical protein